MSGIFRIASNTRDFPDNIRVKTTTRLESLHYFNVSSRRKSTSYRGQTQCNRSKHIVSRTGTVAKEARTRYRGQAQRTSLEAPKFESTFKMAVTTIKSFQS